MQNSGIGNAVNPLLSLADSTVYSIPMLLVVGWRGEPNTLDEPQHKKQGAVTLELFKTFDIPAIILEEDYKSQIDYCVRYMKDNGKPIALIVKKSSFSEYSFHKEECGYTLTREFSLTQIIDALDDRDFIVSTTGKTSREIFEIREKNNQSHSNDFLTVGSMGHASSIAFGLSLHTEKTVYCIDGDGAFLMHLGALAVIAQKCGANFKYILINNGAHESVGGQPTVAFDIDIPKILSGMGFTNVYTAKTSAEIKDGVRRLKKEGAAALVIYTKQGSRTDLGRPTITPADNKICFMRKVGEL
ncbi:sulfopyruvate decarboxylase subunit beta [Clostridia bacterium]|nr:sulfopyruvate decarboxylase subunit beta [Clostridia bacterium]